MRNVLFREWDPIGLGSMLPPDEYDFVTGPLATLLRADAPVARVAATLSDHRTGHLGLEPDPATDQHAADELVAWYRSAIHLATRRSAADR